MKEEYIKPLEDNKLDKTGGSISGIMNVEGALTLPNSPDNPETAEVTDTYSSRQTANKGTTNLTVVDGSDTTVKKIYGSTVASENLIPFPYYGNIHSDYINPNGITFTTNEDGTITVNGTNNGNGNSFIYLAFNWTIPAGTYTLSLTTTGGKADLIMNSSGIYYSVGSGNTYTFTLTEPFKCHVYLQIAKGSTTSYSNVKFSCMLNTGSTAKPYRPYFSGLKNAYFKGIRSYKGKNLINIPTIKLSGAGVSGYDFDLTGDFVFSFSRVIDSDNGQGGGLVSYKLNDETKYITKDTQLPVLISGHLTKISFPNYSKAYGTLSNFQLEVGKTKTDYEEYKGVDESFMLDEAVDLGAWDYVDTETKKIVKKSRYYEFTGEENWIKQGDEQIVYYNMPQALAYSTASEFYGGITTEGNFYPVWNGTGCYMVQNSKTYFVNLGFMINKGILAKDATAVDVDAWKSWLVEKYASGKPYAVYYKAVNENETDLALPIDKYQVWDGGSETLVQGIVDNSLDGAIIGVEQEYKIHENPTEAATKAYVNNGLAKKLDKTGGTITGSLIVEKGADTTLSALVVKNGDVAYGLTYDSEDESYKLGQGTVDEKGNFSFAEGEGAPITLREDSTAFVDGELLKWDATTNRLSSTGVTIEDIKNINKVVRLI